MGLPAKGGRFRLLPCYCRDASAGTTSLLPHASELLAWFTGSTENSHLWKRSIVRRRARKVSSFGLFTDLNLALVFLLIPGARRSQNKSVYPNRRRTSQISNSLSSGAGLGALDALAIGTSGEWLPGLIGRPGILHLAFMISTFNCAPETGSKHAHPVCFFHDMLWSRIFSCGLRDSEEVVSVPDICNVLPRGEIWAKRKSLPASFRVGSKGGPTPFGDFRGRPH